MSKLLQGDYMSKVVILGAGWLGLPLAKQLQTNGFDVLATCRSAQTREKLAKEKINYKHVELNYESVPTEVYDTDCLCILIPPSKNSNFYDLISKITKNPKFRLIEQVIFTSSTSVYEESEFNKNEYSLLKTNNVLTQTEYLLGDFFNICILRLSGLMGNGRYMRKYFEEIVPNAQTTVNHIHLEDAISLIEHVITKKLHGTYNISAPLHPTREQIIKEQCKKLKVQEPFFKSGNSKKGIILTTKIDEEIAYTYKHPNPIDFI